MSTKFLVLMFAIGLTIGIARVQSQVLTGTPVESPSPPKHRTQKTTEAIPPVESAASPSAAESPAGSPTPKRIRRKAAAEVSASPTPTPVAFVQTEAVCHSIGVNSAPANGRGDAAAPLLHRGDLMHTLGHARCQAPKPYHRRLAQPPLHTTRPYFPDVTPGRTGRRTIGH
jgi:cytochrome c5